MTGAAGSLRFGNVSPDSCNLEVRHEAFKIATSRLRIRAHVPPQLKIPVGDLSSSSFGTAVLANAPAVRATFLEIQVSDLAARFCEVFGGDNVDICSIVTHVVPRRWV
jgi:hypothetical protein